MKSGEIPTFGVLQNTNVLCTGSGVAGPFAATLMAEIGARVIHVEHTNGGDAVGRTSTAWDLDHRNQRCMTLNVASDRGREIFLRLGQWAEIWLECSKGGTFARRALGDEQLWKVNPALVVVHFSGYGQHGVAEYVGRPGYDGVAQAFSGYMHWNGPSGGQPTRVKPYMADFVPALFMAFSAVSALHQARRTGVGESIDLAQYEALVRIQSSYLQNALNAGRVERLTGNKEAAWSVYDVFRCADGESVVVMILGAAMWQKAIPMLGLAGDRDFEQPMAVARRPSGAAEKADLAVAKFCGSRPSAQVERELNAAGITCACVLSPTDMVTHPHYKARETIIEWYDEQNGRVTRGPNVVPKYAKHPARVWRGGPAYGSDTDDILSELGYESAEKDEIYQAGVCVRTK